VAVALAVAVAVTVAVAVARAMAEAAGVEEALVGEAAGWGAGPAADG